MLLLNLSFVIFVLSFFSFGDSLTAFVNRLIVFAPILRHIPPISFIHKRFLKGTQTLTGNLHLKILGEVCVFHNSQLNSSFRFLEKRKN